MLSVQFRVLLVYMLEHALGFNELTIELSNKFKNCSYFVKQSLVVYAGEDCWMIVWEVLSDKGFVFL